MRPRRLGAIAAATLLAGLVATPSQSAEASTRRVVENLDRGLVAVPSGQGTFLSWRLLGTEYARYGNAIAFNIYKGGRRLSREPVTKSTTYQDNSPGTGTYTVRAVANGHEQKPSSAALDFAETGDHTALRLYATTEPTKTRIYTLAQNPEYRLGWTVRGYLQSTYTDYYLGTGTRRVPKPAITTTSTEGDASHDDHS
ncbi:rhamnogalacturonan lyase family protein [Streptomyces sp. NBC_01236]|uniref:rhamnogalacturonan endolyase family protein n=1 Tax=Streptomyces sp. NBC_01236 TaxID=2903789 RepID=UPI002E12B28C|nr:hypothetical protein OG324_44855 [Streptomyces sp. NBC_01236]